MNYTEFFKEITAHDPYPYQVELGEEAWPDLLDVPTGLGKTAAVVAAWLWKRLDIANSDENTPRRLVYCLPMRVLVEQTQVNIQEWLNNAEPFFIESGLEVPRAYMLMGGEVEVEWERHPEKTAILIGTQDMLLSRMLNRGYAMSRYKWPVHFALLHNDALWVFDEVQLMGPGLASSAQIEAFRREFIVGIPSRSLWVSATLNPEWLDTIDMRPYLSDLKALTLSKKERKERAVRDRAEATKKLQRFDVTPAGKNASDVSDFLKQLSRVVVEHHERHGSGSNTLVIVNTVARSQELFKEVLKQAGDIPVMLIHARFRAHERSAINGKLSVTPPVDGRIIISTQAIEAGVDITSRTLFTELAPWPSLVQRFGRCNRYGEHNKDGAEIYWIDLPDELASPYDEETLRNARLKLEGLTSASPATLPATDEARPLYNTLRRKDFVELFNTDSDLSGFDIDISPYIRDAQNTDVQVFWRVLSDGFEEQPGSLSGELCRASLKQIDDYNKKRKNTAPLYIWDILDRRWKRLAARNVRPGLMLMLEAREGGYDPEFGFYPQAKGEVPLIEPEADSAEPEGNDDDLHIQADMAVEIETHLVDVEDEVRNLCDSLKEELGEQVALAGRWHDVGKAHEIFQKAAHNCPEAPEELLLAKSPCWSRYERKGFRHELASMLAWLEQQNRDGDTDLIAYLIAAHHGKVRMGLRVWPNENEPEEPDRRFARGIWEGDKLPGFSIDGREEVKPVELRLDLMELGRGAMGRSWRERTETLLDEHGPIYLAWLETLLRIADWRASEAEEVQND